MSTYQHILVGLDLSPDESSTIASKAVALAAASGAKISFAHVVEPLTMAYAGDIPIDLSVTERTMEEHAQERLQKLAEDLQVRPASMEVLLGQTGNELRRLAKELNVDLIVVGSHGRHGLALLFGSTASSVIKGAECDVLAIRI